MQIDIPFYLVNDINKLIAKKDEYSNTGWAKNESNDWEEIVTQTEKKLLMLGEIEKLERLIGWNMAIVIESHNKNTGG